LESGSNYVIEGVFASVGRLLESHPGELLPGTQAVQSLTDAVPTLLAGGQVPAKISELTDRLSRSITPGPQGVQTLNVELLLQTFPAIAEPMAMTGTPTYVDGGQP
jgi:hypothetical protein